MVTLGSRRLDGLPTVYLSYYLDSSLRLVDLQRADNLVTVHDQLYRNGLLDHRFSSEDLERWKHLLAFPTAPDANSAEVRRRFSLEPGLPEDRSAPEPN